MVRGRISGRERRSRDDPTRGTDRLTPFHGRGRALARELKRIGVADVFLHCAGRAYQRFGCPIWMPGVLARWKKKHPSSRLMIFAHELPGEMPITSRHFWLGKASARILRRLASFADLLLTSTHGHAAQWQKLLHRDDITWCPSVRTLSQSRTHPSRVSAASLSNIAILRPIHPRWQAEGRMMKLQLIGPHGD